MLRNRVAALERFRALTKPRPSVQTTPLDEWEAQARAYLEYVTAGGPQCEPPRLTSWVTFREAGDRLLVDEAVRLALARQAAGDWPAWLPERLHGVARQCVADFEFEAVDKIMAGKSFTGAEAELVRYLEVCRMRFRRGEDRTAEVGK